MKSRSSLTIWVEILGALTEGPKLPTRLAQTCRLNFGRLSEYTSELEAKGFIKIETVGGHEVVSVTPKGLAMHGDFERLRAKFAI